MSNYIQVNALGDACPIPVVKTKKAIASLSGSGTVETLVDNEIAVQNLTKMAVQKGYAVASEQLGENQYRVRLQIGEADQRPDPAEPETCPVAPAPVSGNSVVLIAADHMGEGSEELGKTLLKGFLYALSQLTENLPSAVLFFNGGARVTCESSPSLEDLRSLEAQGVEILTCGTCLNYYGLTDQLQVGKVTNMYEIAERVMRAGKVVRI